MLVLDEDMRVLFANDALAGMIHQPRILLLGAYIWDILPLYSSGSPVRKQYYKKIRQPGLAQSLGGTYELVINSSMTSVELSVAHIANSGQTILVARDVTERLQAQAQRIRIAQEQAAREAAELSEQRLLVQYRVASVLAMSLDEKDTVLQILEIVCKSLGWYVGELWSLDAKTQKLTHFAAWADVSADMGSFVKASEKLQFAKGEGLPGRVWQREVPTWSRDVTQEKMFPRKAVAKELGIRGAFAVPLGSGKSFVGVMEFFSNREVKPDVDLSTGMATIGIQIAQFLQRKTVEKALMQSEERLRFMADSLPQKIFTAKPNGEIDYFNPQWTKFTGLAVDEIKGSGWMKLVHPKDKEDYLKAWRHSIQTGEPFQYEYRMKGLDGAYRWHLSQAHALRDGYDKVLMWIGSNTDIEDLRRNLELERMTASLRSQREHLMTLNNAKDEFISLASHQLRTPATGVKQYLGMLLEGYAGGLTEAQVKFARTAYESNERQIAIVNDLLKVAQLDAGRVTLRKQKTDIDQLIQDILDEQASKFSERGQAAEYTHASSAVAMLVDAERLRMALENIIDNASKYSPRHTKIRVQLQKAKGAVTVSVTDQGVGIGKQDIDKIFAKFERVENPLSVAVGGSGLGLYWCKKIIELHGGKITVVSELAQGSTFIVSLPA